MVWPTKLLGFIIKASLVWCFVATPAKAYAKYDRCDFKYIQSENVTICSERKLSTGELSILKDKYRYSETLYRRFLKSYGLTLSKPEIGLTIYLMPFSRINNPALFSRPKGQTLYGKYIDWTGNLYTHYSGALTQSTDLIHELAHYFNNNLNVEDDDLNERMASSFEAYYLNSQ